MPGKDLPATASNRADVATDRRSSRRAAGVLVATAVVVACWLTAGLASAQESDPEPVQGVLDSVPGSEPSEEPAATTTTTTAPAPAPAPAGGTAQPRPKASGSKASAPAAPNTQTPAAADVVLNPYSAAPVQSRPVYRATKVPYPPSAVIPASGGLSGKYGGDDSLPPFLVVLAAGLVVFAGAQAATSVLRQRQSSLAQP